MQQRHIEHEPIYRIVLCPAGTKTEVTKRLHTTIIIRSLIRQSTLMYKFQPGYINTWPISALECYACSNMGSPHDCRHVTVCGENEARFDLTLLFSIKFIEVNLNTRFCLLQNKFTCSLNIKTVSGLNIYIYKIKRHIEINK